MIRLSFIGDIMCEYTRLDSYKQKEGTYDFTALFSEVEDDFNKSDLVVANLETPMAGESFRYSWRDYQFNTPEQIGIAMQKAGIDVVSTANNHVLDRGFEGLDKTLENLDNIGIKHTGSARSEAEALPLIVEVKGMKIGILSYTYGTEACYNGYYLKPGEEYKVNLLRNQELTNPIRRHFYLSRRFIPRAMRAIYRMIRPQAATRTIGELKERDIHQKAYLVKDILYAREHSDYVVMCLHCGGQFNDKPTKYTREIAEFCIENGVNAVIGNHEHCIQESQLKDTNRLITYCLGNFTSNYGIERKPYNKNAECSILLNLYIDEEKKEVVNIGFETLISIKGKNGVITTKPMYDCIINSRGKERQELYKKNIRAINSFLGMDITRIAPQKEYIVSQIGR